MSDSKSFLTESMSQDLTTVVKSLKARVASLERALLFATSGNNIATPALPASGQQYSWLGPGTVTVYIGGGTVTEITVLNDDYGFRTLPFTSGTVRLAAGDDIYILYSVAPTWVFYNA